MKTLFFSVLLSSLAFVGCGGGTPPADSGVASDTGTPSGDSGDNCAAPNFVCCIAGSTSATPPACENGMPVCPESNPPFVRTPGMSCPGGSDASAD